MINKSLILIFHALLFCAAALAQTGDPWKTFNSATGKFSVRIPCNPQETSDDLKSGTSVTKQIYNTCLNVSTGYVVSYADYPVTTTVKALLDQFRDGILRDSQMTAAGEKEISFSTYPGREFSTTSNASTSKDTEIFYSWHIYYIRGRMYGLGVVMKGVEPNTADVSKFFSSFSLEK